MAYTKQNFENGQILTAEQLNHMEQGIAAPDWNDVTNKPFYDLEPWIPPVTLPEPGEEAMIIRNHMISASATDKVCWIKENTKYVVNLNGTDYECESFTISNPQFKGNVYLGNQSILLPLAGNGMPFLLISNTNLSPAGTDVFLEDDSLTTCTISIRLADEPIVKHLDPKYIKDMYYETEVEAVWVEETALEFVEGDENNGFYLDGAIDLALTEGATYSVVWDGTEYKCVCYLYDGAPVIGNTKIWGGPEGNGEPFAIYEYDGIISIATAEGGGHTVSVAGYRAEIHRIDPKYLPEGTPWVKETAEEVYPETTLTMGEDGYPVPQPFAVKIGERFIVTIDGVNYNSSVVNGGTIGGPPVPVLINDGGSFAEPVKSKFAIMFLDPENVIVQPFSGVPVPNPFNLTVRKINTVVRPIDVKCLPEGTPYTAEGGLLYEFNYDGVSAGKVTTRFINGMYVKISDLTPTAAELLGATIVNAWGDGNIEGVHTVVDVSDINADGGSAMLNTDSGTFGVVIYKSGFYMVGDFPETGLYVRGEDGVEYVQTIYKKETIIQPVDPRCIVLTSPNGTKFNLTVSNDGTLSATPVS